MSSGESDPSARDDAQHSAYSNELYHATVEHPPPQPAAPEARGRVRTLDEDIVEDVTMRGAAADDGAAVGPSASSASRRGGGGRAVLADPPSDDGPMRADDAAAPAALVASPGAAITPSHTPAVLTPVEVLSAKKLTKVGSLAKLGVGGSVWKAKFHWDGKDWPVALKVFDRIDDNGAREAKDDFLGFRVEGLAHPNLIDFYGSAVDDKSFCICYEWADGTMYEALGQKWGPSTFAEKVICIRDVARALAYLHDQPNAPVMHRGVNDSNILFQGKRAKLRMSSHLRDGARVKAANPGMHSLRAPARRAVTDDVEALDVQKDVWKPPEVVVGGKYDESADVYSFGLFTWAMLVGKKLSVSSWQGCESAIEWEKALLDDKRPPVDGKAGGQLRNFVKLLEKCWSPDPENRPRMSKCCAFCDKVIASLSIEAPTFEQDARTLVSNLSTTRASNQLASFKQKKDRLHADTPWIVVTDETHEEGPLLIVCKAVRTGAMKSLTPVTNPLSGLSNEVKLRVTWTQIERFKKDVLKRLKKAKTKESPQNPSQRQQSIAWTFSLLQAQDKSVAKRFKQKNEKLHGWLKYAMSTVLPNILSVAFLRSEDFNDFIGRNIGLAQAAAEAKRIQGHEEEEERKVQEQNRIEEEHAAAHARNVLIVEHALASPLTAGDPVFPETTLGISLEILKAVAEDPRIGENTTAWVCQHLILQATVPEGWRVEVAVVEGRDTTRYISPIGAVSESGAEIRDESGLIVTSSFASKLRALSHTGVSEANVFFSHAWTFKFVDVVLALQKFTQEHGSGNKYFFWMDTFALNENLDPPGEYWFQEFRNMIKAINYTCVMMVPWDKPRVLERCWCLWEICATLDCGAPLMICLTPDEEIRFQQKLARDGIDEVEESFRHIDLRHADAWKPEDKQHIHDIVLRTTGYEKLNEQIRKRLKKWTTEVRLRSRMTARPTSLPSLPGVAAEQSHSRSELQTVAEKIGSTAVHPPLSIVVEQSQRIDQPVRQEEVDSEESDKSVARTTQAVTDDDDALADSRQVKFARSTSELERALSVQEQENQQHKQEIQLLKVFAMTSKPAELEPVQAAETVQEFLLLCECPSGELFAADELRKAKVSAGSAAELCAAIATALRLDAQITVLMFDADFEEWVVVTDLSELPGKAKVQLKESNR